MEIGRTFLTGKRNQEIPAQVSQGQTQQKGRYGEDLRPDISNIGKVRRKAPVITAQRVEGAVSDPIKYTKDAIKTALQKAKLALQEGYGKDIADAISEETTSVGGGGGGGGGNKGYFSGSDLSGMSTQQLVDRDNRMYGNTFPEGSFSPTDTGAMVRRDNMMYGNTFPEGSFNITVPKEEKAPMGTTFTGIGTADFLKSFTEKIKPQTVAALPSDYKKTEQRAFDDAESYRKLVASGLDKTVSGESSQANVGSGTKGSFGLGTHGQGAPSGTSLPAGSFGISDKGKAEAAKNKAEAQKKKAEQKSSVPAGSFGISDAGKKQAEANRAEAKKKAQAQKKSTPSTTKSSGRKSNTGSKKSSRGGSKSGGGSKGGTSKGGSKAKSSGSRGQGGGKASRTKGGSFGGKRRRSNTKKSRRRCDIRCKFDISILTNLNLIRDDLADVAYFVKDLQEIN